LGTLIIIGMGPNGPMNPASGPNAAVAAAGMYS